MESVLLIICGGLIPCALSQHPTLTAVHVHTKLPTVFHEHAAIFEGSDYIYIFGGYELTTEILDIVRYTISTSEIEMIGKLPRRAIGGTLHFDRSGNILYFGGGIMSQDVFRFDTSTNKVETVSTLPPAITYRASVKINQSSVLLIGLDVETANCTDIIIFDIDSLNWTSAWNDFQSPYCSYSAVSREGSEEAFLFGRISPVIRFGFNDLKMNVISSNIFNITGTPATVSVGKYAYIIGGYERSSPTNGIFQFDFQTHKFTFIKVKDFFVPETGEIYNGPATVYVENLNRLYLFGGRTSVGLQYSDDIYYIDLTPLNIEEGADKVSNTLWKDIIKIAFPCIFAVSLGTLVFLGFKRKWERRKDQEKRNKPRQELQLPQETLYAVNKQSSAIKVWKSAQPLQLVSLEPIGKGGFSEVYKAQHSMISENKKNYLAIKKIRLYGALQRPGWDIANVLKEVENLAEISNPNVVKLHTCWIEDPNGKIIEENAKTKLQCHEWSSTQEYFLFLQMEYCDGDLKTWLVRNDSLEKQVADQEFKTMFRQIINGLRGIHSKGIIHRDIKPDNIFYCGYKNKIWKIGDLGLSTKVEGIDDSLPYGSRCYKSPEMEQPSMYNKSFKVDVFSLGLTFLETICVFEQPTEKLKVFDQFRNSRGDAQNTFESINVLVDDEIKILVSGMLVANPDNRIDIFDPIINTLLK